MASYDVASKNIILKNNIKMKRPKMSFLNDKIGYNISRFSYFVCKFI